MPLVTIGFESFVLSKTKCVTLSITNDAFLRLKLRCSEQFVTNYKANR